MKKFVTEVAIFTGILALLLFAIKMTLPYYWGNKMISEKVAHVNKQKENYNTFFVGGSTTYRHVIPEIFDRETGSNSFNLGCAGMFYLETHYILENFAHSYPSEQPTNYFVKDMVPTDIAAENLHTVRSKYFMDFKRFRMGFGHYFGKGNYQQAYDHFVSYFENLLSIGEFLHIARFHLGSKPKLQKEIRQQKGYFALDQETAENFTKRNVQFLDSLANNIGAKKDLRQMKLVKLPAEKINISNKNGQINFFQMSGSPEVDDSLFFDRSHMKAAGAKIFTEELARLKQQML